MLSLRLAYCAKPCSSLTIFLIVSKSLFCSPPQFHYKFFFSSFLVCRFAPIELERISLGIVSLRETTSAVFQELQIAFSFSLFGLIPFASISCPDHFIFQFFFICTKPRFFCLFQYVKQFLFVFLSPRTII